MYYLQSRYYDPSIGRFINADSYASTGQGVLGHNMFAYCLNNPVIYSDNCGRSCLFSMSLYDKPRGTYITDQSEEPWGQMTLGSSTVGKMGCGLVAIYNAMISLDDFRSFSQIYAFFDGYPSGLTDHGKNGLFVGYAKDYFKAEGYNVYVASALNIEQFMLYAQGADACIMLYLRGNIANSSGHYVEFSQYGAQYIGRNTVEENGLHVFASPIEYGFRQDRGFFVGIFVCKPHGGG